MRQGRHGLGVPLRSWVRSILLGALPWFQPIERVPSELLPIPNKQGESGVIWRWSAPPLAWQPGKPPSIRVTGDLVVASDGMPVLPRAVFNLHAHGPIREVTGQFEISERLELEKVPDAVGAASKLPELTQRYFPGTFVQAVPRAGGTRLVVFPLQWDRESRRLVRAKTLKVVFGAEGEAERKAESAARAVIVSSRGMERATLSLQAFQKHEYGIEPDLIWVDDLATGAEWPLDQYPDGFKGTSKLKNWILPLSAGGYDFEKARRIAAALQAWRRPDGKHYVILLGDARMVPPSYYALPRGAPNGEPAVTDACYSATEQCLKPWAALGRLPFSNESEVSNYLLKAKQWSRPLPAGTPELAVFGGKAFQGKFYIGELSALRLFEAPGADWSGAIQRFRTSGDFSSREVLKLADGTVGAPLSFFVDHGTGNRFFVDGDFVGSRDFEKAAKSGGQPGVVVSIACSNAAFDAPLLAYPLLNPEYGPESVGVTLLKLASGPVSYLGMGRPALGSPVFQVDASGNIDSKTSTFALLILESFFARHRETPGERIGDVLRESILAYGQEFGNAMRETRHRWTVWNTLLLGDPLLPLPDRKRRNVRLPTARSTQALEPIDPKTDIPVVRFGNGPLKWSLKLEADARVRVWKTGYVDGGPVETAVLDQRLSKDNTSVEIPGDKGPGTYWFRLENEAGSPAERQVVVEAKEFTRP